jgi:hypothetical protein
MFPMQVPYTLKTARFGMGSMVALNTAKWVGVGLVCLAVIGFLADVAYLTIAVVATIGVIAVLYGQSVPS